MIVKKGAYEERVRLVKAEFNEVFDQTGELLTMSELTSDEMLEKLDMTKEEMEVVVGLIFF